MSALVLGIAEQFLDDVTPKAVRAQMQKAIPKIVAGMEKKQMTLAFAAVQPVVRDALFRLWRSVIPSGDIADFIRDLQDDKVVAAVTPELDPDAETEEVVRATLDALIELTF